MSDIGSTEEIIELTNWIARLEHRLTRLAEAVAKLSDERGRTWYKIVPSAEGRGAWDIEAWRNGKLLGSDHGRWAKVEYARNQCTKFLTGMDIHPAVGSFRVDVP